MKNILIIQTAFLGDLILTTGFIRRVKEKYPESKLFILVNQGSESLLAGNPYITKVIPFNKKQVKKNLLEFFKFLKEIRSYNFEICFSPHFSYRSSIIAFVSRSKKRIGYKQAGFSFLLNEKKNRPILGTHEINKLFSLLDEEKTPYKPEIFFLEEEIIEIQEAMKTKCILEKPYIVIAPSSIWETKRMPEEKFQALIELILKKTNFIPLLVGSKADEELSNRILKNFGNQVVNFTGQTNLKELCYLISKAKAVVSNDSAPVHIASAFNIPTVAIFGATIPDFGYTPLSSKQFISEVQGLSCRPCGIHGGRFCPKKHFQCMKAQDPNLIFTKLLDLL
jgi:heptosyltransferase-2